VYSDKSSKLQFLIDARPERAARDIVLTFIASLAGKALGFIRIQQIASLYGATFYGDVLLSVFQLLWLVETVFITGAVSPSLVARIYKVETQNSGQAAARLYLHAASWCMVASLGFGLALYLSSDFVLEVLFPGFGVSARTLFSELILCGVLAPIALTLSNLIGLLNRLSRNGAWYSVPQIITNSLALAGLLIGFSYLGNQASGTKGMIIGLVIGALLSAALQWSVLPNGPRSALTRSVRLAPESLGDLPRSGLWSAAFALMVGALLQESIVYIDYHLASKLGEGQISLLSYSSRLAMLVNMLVVGTAFVILEPRWAKSLATRGGSKPDNRRTTIASDTISLLSVLVLAAALLGVFSGEVSSLIYGQRSFSGQDFLILQELISIYAVLIVLLGFSVVCIRLIVLADNARVVVSVGLVSIPVKIAASLYLVATSGLEGLVWGTILMLVAQCCIFSFVLYRQASVLFRDPKGWAKLIVSSVSVVVFALVLSQIVPAGLLGLLFVSGTVSLFHLALGAAMGLSHATAIVSWLRARVF